MRLEGGASRVGQSHLRQVDKGRDAMCDASQMGHTDLSCCVPENTAGAAVRNRAQLGLFLISFAGNRGCDLDLVAGPAIYVVTDVLSIFRKRTPTQAAQPRWTVAEGAMENGASHMCTFKKSDRKCRQDGTEPDAVNPLKRSGTAVEGVERVAGIEPAT